MRPRLVPGAFVRRHLVAGEARIVLGLEGRAGAVLLGEREWAVLRAADGTRRLDGVVSAAERYGARVSEADVRRLFGGLVEAGLVVDDEALREPIDEPSSPPGDATPSDAAARAVMPLPGFRLRCDGRGSCCRLYGTTLFSEAEATRARALVPGVLEAGDDASRAFTPSAGGLAASAEVAGRRFKGLAVAMVDGACAYLGPRGCRVHEAGGAAAKPLGCRTYPARFVDDGECVRVAPAPECACVFRSARGGEDGDALVSATATVELEPGLVVDRLPGLIVVNQEVSWARSEYLERHRRALVALAAAAPDACGLERLTRLERALLGETVSGVEPRSERLLEVARRERVAELGEQARRRLSLAGSFRARRDLARLVPEWITRATRRALDGVDAEAALADERFYLETLAHAHLWLDDDAPLLDALDRRAARILTARHVRDVVRPDEGPEDPALEHPLALVEALARSL
ncbi:MAG: YkgJ family cysteine cluster protein [Deltaproteobacteria bacterium]|nr:YkgJ family cysteine cluster protein [Deltaproteobacteria bacterium]